MEWIKLYTTVHDDPKLKRISDKSFRVYIEALSWTGRHERDGEYEIAGKASKALLELVNAGLMEQVSDQVFRIHAWDRRQVARREAARAAAHARWDADAMRTHSERNADAYAKPMPREEKSKSREEELPSAPRKRDALFDSLAEVTGRDPKAMTRREARACATALADIKHATPDVSPDEIARRATNYTLHMPHASLTPSALANHWSLCGHEPTSRDDSRVARLVKEAMG